MILDEEKIFDSIDSIKSGKKSSDELKQLIGGEKLNDIFDNFAIKAMIENLVFYGKIHNLMQDGNGLDILEGLLNNHISGDLSNFYMIKPDYIMQLPENEQETMATSIAGGRKNLAIVLRKLWKEGIKTEACSTGENEDVPLIQIQIEENDINSQNFIQKIYQQPQIGGEVFYNYDNRKFTVDLVGNELYSYILGTKEMNLKAQKNNLFYSAVNQTLTDNKIRYQYYIKEDIPGIKELQEEILHEENFIREFELKKIKESDNSKILNFFNKIKNLFRKKKSKEQSKLLMEPKDNEKNNTSKPWDIDEKSKIRIEENQREVAQKLKYGRDEIVLKEEEEYNK